MPDITVNSAAVSPVKVIDSTAGIAGEAFNAGVAVRRHPTTGRWLRSDGSAAGTAAVAGIALSPSGYDGSEVTVLHDGIIDLGKAALDGVNFDAPLYLSDTDAGILGTTAGTVSVIVGRVVPGFASNHSAPDRLLRIKL